MVSANPCPCPHVAFSPGSLCSLGGTAVAGFRVHSTLVWPPLIDVCQGPIQRLWADVSPRGHSNAHYGLGGRGGSVEPLRVPLGNIGGSRWPDGLHAGSGGVEGWLPSQRYLQSKSGSLMGWTLLWRGRSQEAFGETHSFSLSCTQARPLGFAETRCLTWPWGGTDVSRWARCPLRVWRSRVVRLASLGPCRCSGIVLIWLSLVLDSFRPQQLMCVSRPWDQPAAHWVCVSRG